MTVSALPGTNRLDPGALLEIAKQWTADDIVVIGLTYADTGTDTCVASSENDLHRVLGMLECAKDELHRVRSRC